MTPQAAKMMFATIEKEYILVDQSEYRTLKTWQEPAGWMFQWEDDPDYNGNGFASREDARSAGYALAAALWPGFRNER